MDLDLMFWIAAAIFVPGSALSASRRFELTGLSMAAIGCCLFVIQQVLTGQPYWVVLITATGGVFFAISFLWRAYATARDNEEAKA